MKRTSSLTAVLGMLVSLLASLGVVMATPAQAVCGPPDGIYTIYSIANKATLFYPTNVKSDWVYWPNGGTITYAKTATAEVNASMTATVEAEAGVIFAKASTSFGVTVGGSWSKSDSWSYSANVPSGSSYRYRLHMYHYAVRFDVMKKRFMAYDCRYHNVWSSWQRVKHAPAKSNRNVWRLDRAAV